MKLLTALVVGIVMLCAVPARAQSQEISLSGAWINGELYTGISGRINQLVDVLGTKADLDINAFTVTNPRDGVPVAGFSLTARKRIALNAWGYAGPALRWKQGEKSTIGLAFGILVTVTPEPPSTEPPPVVVWKRVDGRDVIVKQT